MSTIEEDTHKFFVAETERLTQEAGRIETVEELAIAHRAFQVAMIRRREAFQIVLAARRRRHEQEMEQMRQYILRRERKVRTQIILSMVAAVSAIGLTLIICP